MQRRTSPLMILGALGVTTLLVLTSCNRAAELALDDSWALDEIQAGDLIKTNLGDYITVKFDSSAETATITVGPDWSKLSNVDVSGTFDFSVNGRDNTIVLSRSGEERYRIGYSFDATLGKLTWNRWEATRIDPGVTIVGPDSLIKHIAFVRE